MTSSSASSASRATTSPGCNAKGQVTVNVALEESEYLYPGNAPSDANFDIVVPEGKLWVMGDHRAAMPRRPRAHLGDPGGGFVPTDRVIGRAFAVVWPFSDAQILSTPSTFDQPATAGSRVVAATSNSW
ncbi:MAG: S26 family signal peptidase [Candidatus Nanopelagicales bacterium]